MTFLFKPEAPAKISFEPGYERRESQVVTFTNSNARKDKVKFNKTRLWSIDAIAIKSTH